MRFNGVIENKLRVIEEKLAEIESWKIISLKQLQENSMLRSAAERALQVAIEATIDICERILALHQVAPASTSVDAVYEVIKMGILKHSDDYLDMIRFRNFIVHRYENIDTAIVFAILQKKLGIFRQFVHEIRNS